MRFDLRHFNQLHPDELYRIMVLRQRVFVLEQHCVFVDCDDLDQPAWHLMYYTENGTLVAYCRLLPIDTSYPGYVSIGRVVSDPAYRQVGYGRLVMQQAIQQCSKLFGDSPIKIGAQVYLKQFYESFGFSAVDEVYLEDGIEHIKMIRP